jgi:hypothetical protein
VVWAVVVVGVVVAAVVVSVVGSSEPDPSGDDLSAFCPAVEAYWNDLPLFIEIDLGRDPADYERARADLVRLRDTAPGAIRPDVVVVVEGVDGLAMALRDLSARSKEDRGFDGFEQASIALRKASAGRERAAERFVAYAKAGCNIDLQVPPTTTAPPSSEPEVVNLGSVVPVPGGPVPEVPTTTTPIDPTSPLPGPEG